MLFILTTNFLIRAMPYRNFTLEVYDDEIIHNYGSLHDFYDTKGYNVSLKGQIIIIQEADGRIANFVVLNNKCNLGPNGLLSSFVTKKQRLVIAEALKNSHTN